MSACPPFPAGCVEALAKLLGEVGSGSDLSRYFAAHALVDDSNESTKWRRINAVFLKSQKTTKSANQFLAFIKSYLSPERFVGKRELFEEHRSSLRGCPACFLILKGVVISSHETNRFS
ncbi:hypothetical protein AB9L11_01995 [Desulfovibrio piger]